MGHGIYLLSRMFMSIKPLHPPKIAQTTPKMPYARYACNFAREMSMFRNTSHNSSVISSTNSNITIEMTTIQMTTTVKYYFN